MMNLPSGPHMLHIYTLWRSRYQRLFLVQEKHHLCSNTQSAQHGLCARTTGSIYCVANTACGRVSPSRPGTEALKHIPAMRISPFSSSGPLVLCRRDASAAGENIGSTVVIIIRAGDRHLLALSLSLSLSLSLFLSFSLSSSLNSQRKEEKLHDSKRTAAP
jgi:hypothetical protein